jgi:hypothetical protein
MTLSPWCFENCENFVSIRFADGSEISAEELCDMRCECGAVSDDEEEIEQQ